MSRSESAKEREDRLSRARKTGAGAGAGNGRAEPRPEVGDCGPRGAGGAGGRRPRKEGVRKTRSARSGFNSSRAMAPQGSLDEYLRDISAYPLIDREQEAQLARRIAKGDEEAKCKLVNSNLRFVVSIAKKYQNQGVALSDLISEGNLGLIRAAEKFDETKGVKFISYAVWWIRQAILQALAEQSRIVRVPLNRAGELHRLGKRSNALVQELGREPTISELAQGLDVPEEEIHRTLSIAAAHLSLDAPLAPGEDNKLLDYLADDQRAGPEEEVIERALRANVERALESLKPRERQILKMYYGLDGGEPMTLEQIGGVLGVTRERVRQIKERALGRLRHVERARSLESFRE